jgi:hypothetical protein
MGSGSLYLHPIVSAQDVGRSAKGKRIVSNSGYFFLFFIHITQGTPIPFLPTPPSKRASRIFLQRDRGFVPAMIASRDPGSDGGTNAEGIPAY